MFIPKVPASIIWPELFVELSGKGKVWGIKTVDEVQGGGVVFLSPSTAHFADRGVYRIPLERRDSEIRSFSLLYALDPEGYPFERRQGKW